MLTIILQEMIDDLESIKLITKRFENGSFSHGPDTRRPVNKVMKTCREFINGSLDLEKVLAADYRKSREGVEDGRKNNKGNEKFMRVIEERRNKGRVNE